MINMVLLAIVIVLLIVCLVLLFILLKKTNQKEVKEKTTPVIVKEEIIDVQDIEVPKKILKMGHHLLTQSCIKVFDAFNALDYANKNEKVLNNIEWHSWQVSLLITLIQNDGEFFVPNPHNIIHSSVANKPMSTIESYMQRIYRKYINNVNINNSRDQLSKDVIWSAKEVSVIFFYMANMKKNSKNR